MPGDRTGVVHVCRIRVTPDLRAFTYSYVRSLGDLFLVTGLGEGLSA